MYEDIKNMAMLRYIHKRHEQVSLSLIDIIRNNFSVRRILEDIPNKFLHLFDDIIAHHIRSEADSSYILRLFMGRKFNLHCIETIKAINEKILGNDDPIKNKIIDLENTIKGLFTEVIESFKRSDNEFYQFLKKKLEFYSNLVIDGNNFLNVKEFFVFIESLYNSHYQDLTLELDSRVVNFFDEPNFSSKYLRVIAVYPQEKDLNEIRLKIENYKIFIKDLFNLLNMFFPLEFILSNLETQHIYNLREEIKNIIETIPLTVDNINNLVRGKIHLLDFEIAKLVMKKNNQLGGNIFNIENIKNDITHLYEVVMSNINDSTVSDAKSYTSLLSELETNLEDVPGIEGRFFNFNNYFMSLAHAPLHGLGGFFRLLEIVPRSVYVTLGPEIEFYIISKVFNIKVSDEQVELISLIMSFSDKSNYFRWVVFSVADLILNEIKNNRVTDRRRKIFDNFIEASIIAMENSLPTQSKLIFDRFPAEIKEIISERLESYMANKKRVAEEVRNDILNEPFEEIEEEEKSPSPQEIKKIKTESSASGQKTKPEENQDLGNDKFKTVLSTTSINSKIVSNILQFLDGAGEEIIEKRDYCYKQYSELLVEMKKFDYFYKFIEISQIFLNKLYMPQEDKIENKDELIIGKIRLLEEFQSTIYLEDISQNRDFMMGENFFPGIMNY